MKIESRQYINGLRRDIYPIASSDNKVLLVEGRYYIADQNAKRISLYYEKIKMFPIGLGVAKRQDRYGIINSNGEEVVKCVYENTWIDQDIIRVRKDGKWILLDKSGLPICSLEFDFVEKFNDNGFARFQLGELWGVITKDMTIAIPPNYFYLGDLDHDKVVAKNLRWYGVIDLNNNVVVPFKYSHMRCKDGKLILSNKKESCSIAF